MKTSVSGKCGECVLCGKCNTPQAPDSLKRKEEMSAMVQGFRIDNEFKRKGGGVEYFGLSFDIGTTTVVGMLWNLVSGEPAGAKAESNPQAAHGADVISRIMFAEKSKDNLLLMQREIIECLNRITGELIKSNGISPDSICDVTIAGNTTMSHLVAGICPGQLARAPFTPAFYGAVRKDAAEFGLSVNPKANVTILPNIAGHVGSDITAGIVAAGIMRKAGVYLMIDVGTNGEIVLCQDGKALACSTAAGPAFEGASVYQGMRASEGAIERVDIRNGEVLLQTIGDFKASGLCGSGIIDAAAELFKAGLVEKTGRLINAEKAREKGIAEALASRLRDGKTGREFVLAYAGSVDDGADGARDDASGADDSANGANDANDSANGTEDVVITQNDIREVQLAKAAIRAGIKLMLKEFGIDETSIEQIYIAGAFGNHIRPESAAGIGLIPDIGKEKIMYIGNAAGIGASMALLSTAAGEEINEAAKVIRHMELAEDPLFQDTYLKAMAF